MGDWHKSEVSDVALELGTDVKIGRTNIDSSRIRKHNNNVFHLPNTDAKSIVRQMASDASLILLAVTYLLSSLLGHANESVIGIAFVAAVFLIGCSLKYQSEMRVTNSYRMLLPAAKVTENGQKYRLSVFDVEVGDLINFAQGDIIPADARLVSSSNLNVAERCFDEATGKSIYKRFVKNHDTVVDDADSTAHYENMVYAGSMVVSGKGSAIVTEIGNDTVVSKLHSGISFAPPNDKPQFLRDFRASSKRFSLIALFCVIPVALFGLFTQTLNTADAQTYNLLYMFLLSVSLASTCMSELVAAPAESLVTKEILPSSRAKKNERTQESRITKLSAAEALADTDTFLILSPEILSDKKQLVRRIYFDDKKYRFDALASKELNDFAAQVYPFFAYLPPKNNASDSKAIKSYLNSFALRKENGAKVHSVKYLMNYPIAGARSCVFEFDTNGLPIRYIARSNDISLLRKCAFFRTEGGGVWRIDNDTIKRIADYFDSCVRDGLDTHLYISRENLSEKPIFEGIIAVGEEFPYADGCLTDDFTDSGILPILVLEDETQANINFALKCGMVKDLTEIAIESEYSRAGLKITDASITTKVYIGFGKSGTEQLAKRLYGNGKNVLPIIKDSADRRAVSPNTIYATHQFESFDSVKIASSMSIKPADSESRTGGLFDALKAVRGSSMARLKLGVYKNYLIYSSFVRITAIGVPMLLGKTGYLMTSLMVLLSGFVCDYLALFVVMHTKQTTVRPRNSVSDAKRLFSSSLAVFSAVGAFVASLSAFLACSILVAAGKMPLSDAPSFMMCSSIAVQWLALGGFLAVLKKHTRSEGINLFYCSVLAVGVCILILQSLLPGALFGHLGSIGFSQISANLIPYMAFPALIAFLSVVLLVGRMMSFASSK